MRIFIIRHGNTFGPGDRIIRAGATEDLPLVERGIQQAQEIASFFKTNNIKLDQIYSGPLKRTRESAEIIRSSLELDSEPIIDSRLNEIDYGKWGGLTDDEISSQFSPEALDSWNKKSIWPDNMDWKPTEAKLTTKTLELISELTATNHESIALYTSNGRLRYFLKAIPGLFEEYACQEKLKVKTGHFCEFEYLESSLQLKSWNSSPV